MKQKTKSPLKDKPLRNPGQSIDESIDKLINDEALKYIIISTFCIVLAITEWWRWYANLPYSPGIYTAIAIMATAYSSVKLVKAKKQLINLKLGRDGERVVGQYLESLREEGCKIFHDIVGDAFNIDHVIISKHGVFIVETKTYSKPTNKEPTIKYNGIELLINNNQPMKDILTQAKAEANWLKNMLNESTGKAVQVKPVIVFPGWNIDNKDAGFNPEVWVINPKAISKFIPKSGMELSQYDVSLFTFHLSRYIRTKIPLEN